MASIDPVPLGTLIGVGLGQPTKWLLFESPKLSAGARTAMILAGAGLLAVGASADLFVRAALTFRRVNWRQVGATIVHISECSRWFFTVINISRDVYKRW
ncbi:hypothetical protein SBRCBS47491_000748 [Sporothrix bragantina]|uniref:Uncharacterized protein n=1 Tax=Sporothrix bragantina TaxID=671064 RepID=A0ABP0AT09_9PEZI